MRVPKFSLKPPCQKCWKFFRTTFAKVDKICGTGVVIRAKSNEGCSGPFQVQNGQHWIKNWKILRLHLEKWVLPHLKNPRNRVFCVFFSKIQMKQSILIFDDRRYPLRVPAYTFFGAVIQKWTNDLKVMRPRDIAKEAIKSPEDDVCVFFTSNPNEGPSLMKKIFDAVRSWCEENVLGQM